MAKEPNLPYYLPTSGGSRDGFMPLLRILQQSEIQTAFPGIELGLPIQFLTMRMITLRSMLINHQSFSLSNIDQI